jgi:hypothetical protein
MNEEQSKDSKPMTDRERGRAFLEGFKKMPYNRDRIGQSFIMKQKSTSQNHTENQELTAEEFYKKLGIPNATKKMEGKVRLTLLTGTAPKPPLL